jgi:intraflagellar transport protein 80
VAWTPDGQLFSCSDDKTIWKWTADGESVGKVTSFDNLFITNISWIPPVGKQVRQSCRSSCVDLSLSQAADLFAAACADGTYRFISRSGREEKKIQAHEGAVICISWSHDGAALLTAGEEGDVKIWSRSGNMRSILASTGQSVYCACWGPDDDQIVFACGLSILSLPLSSPLSLSLCLSLSVSVSLSRQHSYDQNCPS